MVALPKSTPDLLFKLSLLVALLLLIALSWNAPISGDEYVHVNQAEKNIDYLKSFGTDREALNTPISRLKHYGQSFDTITLLLARALNINDLYRFRHVSNALVAWLTILFSALIAMKVAKDKYAGVITIILFLVSMRFMGHATNNLKDIPFAFSFIFSIYFIFRFVERLPKISFLDLAFVALGLAFGISIRIGGLLIFAYFILFNGLYVYYLAVNGRLDLSRLTIIGGRLVAISFVVLILGYFVGILVWPWALEHPVANPIKSMQLIHNYPTTVRQIFEGKLYWSENFPWYYLFKYLLITVPLIVWLGFLLLITLIWKWKDQSAIILSIFLLISFGFPLFYTTVSGANVYGGWRQLLFVYPPLVVLSSIGIWLLIREIAFNKLIRSLVVAGLVLFLIYPLYFLVRHYPYQYVYFNALAGGVGGAYGNYELDYYFTSFKKAFEFIDGEVKEDGKIVAANFIIPEYYKDKNYQPKLIDYYDRGSFDWDYAIICNTFLDPYQLRKGIWPPQNVVYKEIVNDVPILVVLKREGKEEWKGKKLLVQGRFNESIQVLSKAKKRDPNNESILLNLARANLRSGLFDDAIAEILQLEEIYPNNEWATDIRGEIAMGKGELKRAKELFKGNIEYNYKFYHSYINLARAHIKLGEKEQAIKTLKKCLRINPYYQPAYQVYGKLLIEKGEIELGSKMLEFQVEDYSKYKRK